PQVGPRGRPRRRGRDGGGRARPSRAEGRLVRLVVGRARGRGVRPARRARGPRGLRGGARERGRAPRPGRDGGRGLSPSGTEALGVAVVGAGRIGALHARHLLGAVEGARLVTVVDPDVAAAQRAAGGAAAVAAELEEALADPRVDAVVIASPTDRHVEQLHAVAAAGKPVFCEKPVARTLVATQAALRAVQGAGVPFQIGFNRRFDPAYAEVARAVRAGEVGRVELFRSQSTDPAPPPEEYVAVSGGFFRDSV